MATLQEYYLKDFSKLLSTHADWTFRSPTQGDLIVRAKVHLDFDSNTFFISFYVPVTSSEIGIFTLLLSRLDEVFKIKDGVEVKTSMPGESELISTDLQFSGRVFFYYEGLVNQSEFFKVQTNARSQNLFLHYRDTVFSSERGKLERPLAFISHDSRDKEVIATPIAVELQKRILPIWYDEYSLKLGDSLRETIEKGLKECKKCILILSPNFLSNTGWTKAEFNMIFTREIIESNNLVLPIWAGVSKKEIYEYSPILVDRVGINWDKGIDVVVNKIQQVLIAE